MNFNWTLAKNDPNAYRANDPQIIYFGTPFANRFSMFFHVVMLKPNSEQLVEILISSRGLSQTFFFHSKMQANNATIDNKCWNCNLQVNWTGGQTNSCRVAENFWESMVHAWLKVWIWRSTCQLLTANLNFICSSTHDIFSSTYHLYGQDTANTVKEYIACNRWGPDLKTARRP